MNAQNMGKALKNSAPILQPKAASGTLSVVAAHYDLDTVAIVFSRNKL
jgi:hypothetical protein